MPTTITITVEKDPANPPGGVLLSDGKTTSAKLVTSVWKDDTVIWKLKDRSGITSIDNVKDQSSVNLFRSGPKPTNDKKQEWQGVIGDHSPGEPEDYILQVTIDGKTYPPQDPKLIMTKPTPQK